ncbi:MAG: RusA family crossover junction endodeoxyribonuclease [Oscillospiraceae bacterium]|jgi:Holliday junction resolvase RusA-like endonuclease|nr:RusA family crossover junction endodeoxyribonuclease [Oscillospiraceae bacterium]
MSAAQLPLRFTLPGDPRTKKNSMRVLKNGPRPVLMPSAAFEAYQESAGWRMPCKDLMISRPVNVKAVYWMATRRPVDLGNLLAATCDILAHYGVIADDCRDIVASTDGSRVYWDKANPRVEIEITAIAEDYEQWRTKK